MSPAFLFFVIPAQAGIQGINGRTPINKLSAGHITYAPVKGQ
jgi:hypothetical protein